MKTGQLYIVSTPIGNMEDITFRACNILKKVDLIAAENTRRTSRLLNHFKINTRSLSFHKFNEHKMNDVLLVKLKKGYDIALVSDSGTPIISDPGFILVKTCLALGIKVVPLPGPCAAISALASSGLPTNRFCYEGFLPRRPTQRKIVLKNLKNEERTIILYESTHRVQSTLEDINSILGTERYIVIAKEITKFWESISGASVIEWLNLIKKNKISLKGELVLVIEGNKEEKKKIFEDSLRTFDILKRYLPLKQSVKIASDIHKTQKNILYEYALISKDKDIKT